MTKRQVNRLVDIVHAFNRGEKAVAELIGEEKARELFDRQRDVASKVHRSPPKCLDGMRF